MYTERREFARAQASYEKARQLAPTNPLIVAGAINSALEGHQLPVAKSWLDRASPALLENPQVMREHERYLTFTKNYQASAALGYRVIQKLPRDPEAPVYLAYDLLFLERYPEAMQIVERFQPLMPKDKDLSLIAGHVHAHNGEFEEAIDDFTRALERDPTMATGYMNRGYVENDVRLASKAEQDFRKAIELRPDYGEAHLGLAFSYLQLRHSKAALKEQDIMRAVEMAERTGGNNSRVLLATAEALLLADQRDQAMQRYARALEVSDADRLDTRLALARLLAREHNWPDARQQIAMGFAESRVSDASVITAENYLNAADILMSMNQFKNAQQFFQRAQNAGADEL